MPMPDTNGWIEGMESAPRDRPILVCVGYIVDGLERHEASVGWWVQKMSGGYWEWIDPADESAECDAGPTHWKPLDLPVVYQEKEQAA